MGKMGRATARSPRFSVCPFRRQRVNSTSSRPAQAEPLAAPLVAMPVLRPVEPRAVPLVAVPVLRPVEPRAVPLVAVPAWQAEEPRAVPVMAAEPLTDSRRRPAP